MSDVVFKATLDDTEVAKALNRIDKNIAKLARRGEDSFDKVEDSATKAGVKIGAVSGVVQELAGRFIDMGIQAIKAFGAIAKESVELNKELELARVSVTSIFGGNQKAAEVFLETIKESAIQLGISRTELTQLAKGVLPDIGSIDLTKQFVESFVVLGRDAAQNFTSIRIAAEEALSGNLLSLQKRLNIPPAVIDRIKQYQAEFGKAEGIVKALQERIEDTGISIETTAGTLSVLTGQAKGAVEEIKLIFGEPIFEELKEQIITTLAVFEEHRDDIERVAAAFGDLAAKVIELVGGGLRELIEGIDADKLEKAADNFSDLLVSAQLLAEILFDPDLLNSLITGTDAILVTLTEALITAAKIQGLVSASEARQTAEALKAAELSGIGVQTPEGRRIAPFLVAPLLSSAEQAEVAAAGQKAHEASIEDTLAALGRHSDSLKENEEKTEARREETEKATDADKAAGEAILKRKKDLDDLARAESEATDAQEKITERQEKFARDVQKRLTKIQLEGERDRINDLIKSAQKREDIARKNAQKIEDIFRENQQDITDAATDLSREEQDIARRAARDRGEIERDLANERVDIERDFRQELLRIQQQFNQSAEEAERNNDAQAFLQAVRTRDDQIGQAQLRREGNIDEAKIEGERRRDELKKSLAFEIEDAKISNRRKLEDLQISLQRELDAQQINLDRQLEAQAIAEARQAQERQLAIQRSLEDFATANRLKREDLQRNLEAEFAAVRAFETAKANFAIAETRRAVDAIRRLRAQLFGRGGGGGGGSTPLGLPTSTPLRTMQEGGPVNPNQPFLVGEAGPELFVPAQAGNIIPNSTLFAPPVQSAAIQQLSQSNTTNSPTFNLAESMFNDPVARQNLSNFILETMGGI